MQILPVICIIAIFISGTGMAHGQTDGTLSLDKTKYPMPFGGTDYFYLNQDESPSGRSVFPIHPFGLSNDGRLDNDEFIEERELEVLITINDPDFNLSPSEMDVISADTLEGVGPVKVSVIRGSDVVVLGYVGGTTYSAGLIDVGDDSPTTAMQDTYIYETGTDTGIFEYPFDIELTDGPASLECPAHRFDDSFDVRSGSGESYCILKGDILKVEYTDISDSSGNTSTVTATARFDLNDSQLKTDRSIYIVGSDMILTLIDPDLDITPDPDRYTLDLIGWDSDAATLSMGKLHYETLDFDPYSLYLEETGRSTGVFQATVKMPQQLKGNPLDRGEEITLEYVDWSPSSALYVGSQSSNTTTTVHTSNFGATVQLDQETYTWTDRVHITVIAPDFNSDDEIRDEIGGDNTNPIKISTREYELSNYKLVESDTDTGIFTGEVTLAGFAHDVDGDGMDDVNPRTGGSGSTDGVLETVHDDSITFSFEFAEETKKIASSPIKWNIGEIEWKESRSLTTNKSTVWVVDKDMNLDPNARDSFVVHVWSDTDNAGIDITLEETDTATGIFVGGILFATEGKSYEIVLRVTEGDTVTAKYVDHTLPKPYATMDRLDVIGTMYIPKSAAGNDIPNDSSETYTGTVNTVAPVITSVNAVGGTYKEGHTVRITIGFSDSVTVTGMPELELGTGTRDSVATYASGSPGTSLEFNYTVSDDEETDQLDYAATDSLSLNGGAIHLTNNSSLPAILGLPSLGSMKSLAGSDVVIDNTIPMIQSIVTSSESGIKITASEPLAGHAWVFDFAVSGEADIAISSVRISGSLINLSLDGKIAEGDMINLSYLGSFVTDIAGNDLDTFDRTVKNTIPKDSPDPKPFEPEPESPESWPITLGSDVRDPKPFEPEPESLSDSVPETVAEPRPESDLFIGSEPQTVAEPGPTFPAEPPCEPGTYASNGVCVVDDRDDIFSIIISLFENLLG